MPTDKEGNVLTWKEYGARWKKGIEGVTPLQQLKVQMQSTWIMLVGIVAGIVICLIAIKSYWWLLLILVGALGNTSVQQLGLWQKVKIFKQLEGGGLDG